VAIVSYMYIPCNTFITFYIDVFSIIYEGYAPFFQCKMSPDGSKSVREVNGLSLIFCAGLRSSIGLYNKYPTITQAYQLCTILETLYYAKFRSSP